jgi:mRNA interferase RelE/StbE
MDTFTIEWKRTAEKELRKIATSEISRLVETVEALSHNPFPVGHRKLAATENSYRVRVGDYRIVYTVQTATKQIVIEHIRHRRDAYR